MITHPRFETTFKNDKKKKFKRKTDPPPTAAAVKIRSLYVRSSDFRFWFLFFSFTFVNTRINAAVKTYGAPPAVAASWPRGDEKKNQKKPSDKKNNLIVEMPGYLSVRSAGRAARRQRIGNGPNGFPVVPVVGVALARPGEY